MSTDRAALLAGIFANADADLPRLVFADWLDENGDTDRAEFIRAQIELSGLHECDDGAAELEIRCEELLRLHRAEWCEGFPNTEIMFGGSRFHIHGGYGDEWPGWTVFDRGFPSRLQATTDSVVSLCEQARRSGLLRGVSLESRSKPPRGGYHRLSGAERLRDLRVFGLDSTTGVRAAVKLLERATGLRVVDFSGCRVGEPESLSLLGMPATRNAVDLSICGTQLSPEGERRFAECDFPNLRHLTRVWVPHVDWLSAKWVPQLESLTIHDTEPLLSEDQATAVADILPGSNIRDLELEWWPMSEATAARLGSVDSAAGIRSLAFAPMRRATADTLRLSLGTKPRLRSLVLSHSDLTPEFVTWLGASDLAQQLRLLRLDAVTIEGLAALADSPVWSQLQTLGVGIQLTGQGKAISDLLSKLLTAQRFPALRTLYLTDPEIRGRAADADKHLQAALASDLLPQLQRFGFFLGPISPAGGKRLAGAKSLDALRVLDVRLDYQTKAQTQAILEARFGKRVRCY